MTKLKIGDQVTLSERMGIAGVTAAWVTHIDGGDVWVELIVNDRIVNAHRYPGEMEPANRPTCKGSISIGSGCRRCDSCYEQIKEGITPYVQQENITPYVQQEKPRKMKPIPVSAGETIAKEYGYDQVVIMARRTSNPLPPIAPEVLVDDAISGEHITTYGINRTHCDIAALMGNVLKDIARWPEKKDFDLARDLLDDLDSGTFDYSDYDQTSERIGALRRIIARRTER